MKRKDNDILNRPYPERRSTGFDLTNPFSALRRFSEEMDRMFGGFLTQEPEPVGQNQPQTGSTTDWTPAIEIIERDNKILIRADLPGINPDDVKVELQDDGLIIEGETRAEHEEEKKGFY